MPWSEDDLARHKAKHRAQYPEQEGDHIDSMDPATAKKKARKRTMNSTERRYEQYILEPSRIAGEVLRWTFEGLRFRLADGAWYKPDFNVIMPDGLLVNIEVKGGIIHEATIVRVKVAREAHSWCKFEVWQWKGGAWLEKNKA